MIPTGFGAARCSSVNAKRNTPFFPPCGRKLAGRGAVVLIGDPGRNYLPKDNLEALQTYEVQTTRELEDREVRRTTVYRVSSARGAGPT